MERLPFGISFSAADWQLQGPADKIEAARHEFNAALAGMFMDRSLTILQKRRKMLRFVRQPHLQEMQISASTVQALITRVLRSFIEECLEKRRT